MNWRRLGLIIVVSASSAWGAEPPKIPLCSGLTVVTAISQPDGDYESIKTIESVSEKEVALRYSAERPERDFPNAPPRLRKHLMHRTIRVDDLASARLYLQQYFERLPDMIPGTTAIGTSGAVLSALRSAGETELAIFDLPPSPLSADPDQHPSVFDYRTSAKVHRVEAAPVMLPVIVNDEKMQLPAIHAAGNYAGDKAEFFFLDDDDNPLALKYRIGAGANGSAGESGASDDTLLAIKIAFNCSAAPATSRLEQMLAQNQSVDIYSIYFSFNSDQVRPESDPTLQEISDVLHRHPDWKLMIAGHTDGIGGDEKNLDLSQRRSAAVRDALVSRYQVDANRLSTTGFGKSQPKDTNDTPEGRAHNRRVELARQ